MPRMGLSTSRVINFACIPSPRIPIKDSKPRFAGAASSRDCLAAAARCHSCNEQAAIDSRDLNLNKDGFSCQLSDIQFFGVHDFDECIRDFSGDSFSSNRDCGHTTAHWNPVGLVCSRDHAQVFPFATASSWRAGTPCCCSTAGFSPVDWERTGKSNAHNESDLSWLPPPKP